MLDGWTAFVTVSTETPEGIKRVLPRFQAVAVPAMVKTRIGYRPLRGLTHYFFILIPGAERSGTPRNQSNKMDQARGAGDSRNALTLSPASRAQS